MQFYSMDTAVTYWNCFVQLAFKKVTKESKAQENGVECVRNLIFNNFQLKDSEEMKAFSKIRWDLKGRMANRVIDAGEKLQANKAVH